MPGVVQHTRDSLRKAAHEAVEAGVGGLILFGIPAVKDADGSQADAAEGIVQVALRDLAADLGDCDRRHGGPVPVRVHRPRALWAADCCRRGRQRRHACRGTPQSRWPRRAPALTSSRPRACRTARSRRSARRSTAAGFASTPVLAYAAKYASAFYGPFREAAESTPSFGDRRSYQLDPANAREALREVALDLAEGADAVMVKPALPYLDVLRQVADAVDVPVFAYQVSGEYAMVEAAAAAGWLDRERVILETLTGIRRAGADAVLTYWATEVARLLARLSFHPMERLEPLIAARRVVDETFPSAIAAFLAGSSLTSERTSTSDLDIVVVLEGPPAPYRETRRAYGWLVELFVQTPSSLRHYWAKETQALRSPMLRMCADGVVLVSVDAFAEDVQTERTATVRGRASGTERRGDGAAAVRPDGPARRPGGHEGSGRAHVSGRGDPHGDQRARIDHRRALAGQRKGPPSRTGEVQQGARRSAHGRLSRCRHHR